MCALQDQLLQNLYYAQIYGPALSLISMKLLKRRYNSLHLVRIGAFDSVGVDGCGHVRVGLTGLNRAVAVIHRWVQ